MKAIVNEKYGSPDVLKLKEVDKPSCDENQMLIKIHAVSVNAYDWHLLMADPFLVRFMGVGFLKPKKTILGADIAGIVESVGKNITRFKPGDEVCGCNAGNGCGGFAEYVCAPEKAFVLKPSGITFEEASAFPMAASTALQGLRDNGQVIPGMKVLVNGASGGVGTFAVQIAKILGADVTAVTSTGNIEMVRSLGADKVIDRSKENFTRNNERYDLIFAANGYHSIMDYRRALTPNGKYVMAGGSAAQMFQAFLLAPIVSKFGTKKMEAMGTKVVQKDLEYLKELIEAGKLRSVIDRYYKLDEVPEAISYVHTGHAKGKVVITIAD